jgi:hypothetical protein
MNTLEVLELARAFSFKLREYLSEEEFQKLIVETINEKSTKICHSHDFLDANEIMSEVFCKIKRHQAIDSEHHVDINKAWMLAKSNLFFSKEPLFVKFKDLGEFNSWQETHFEMVAHIQSSVDHPCFVADTHESEGRGGLYLLAEELTDEFEEIHKNTDWKEENYIDEIEIFLSRKHSESK